MSNDDMNIETEETTVEETEIVESGVESEEETD